MHRFFLQSEKSYRAEVTLGTQTNTDDVEGEIISSKEVDITELEAKETLLTFLGASDQLPPDYSALSIKGNLCTNMQEMGLKLKKQTRKIFIKKYNKIF